MRLSVVIPLYNEEESLKELFQRIQTVCTEHCPEYEVIFVDDGSSDDSWKIIQTLSEKFPEVKGIRFMRNFGKSQGLMAGFREARGEYIITMDADLQDFPEEIPGLLKMLEEKDADLISGWKQKRKDPKLSKNLPSKLFNKVARSTSGLKLHDFNCGLKAYRAEAAKQLDLKGDMHRYIPVLVKHAGYTRIYEMKVQHTSRKYGKSKYGNRRFINGFLDLITLYFLHRFGSKPMHFFGAFGTLMFILGFLAALYLGIDKLYKVYVIKTPARLITDNAFFYISLTAMIIGTQLFLAGFLGEILVRTQKGKKEYEVKETVNLNTEETFLS